MATEITDQVARQMAMTASESIKIHMQECHDDKREFRKAIDSVHSRIDDVLDALSKATLDTFSKRSKILLSIAASIIMLETAVVGWLINAIFQFGIGKF